MGALPHGPRSRARSPAGPLPAQEPGKCAPGCAHRAGIPPETEIQARGTCGFPGGTGPAQPSPRGGAPGAGSHASGSLAVLSVCRSGKSMDLGLLELGTQVELGVRQERYQALGGKLLLE